MEFLQKMADKVSESIIIKVMQGQKCSREQAFALCAKAKNYDEIQKLMGLQTDFAQGNISSFIQQAPSNSPKSNTPSIMLNNTGAVGNEPMFGPTIQSENYWSFASSVSPKKKLNPVYSAPQKQAMEFINDMLEGADFNMLKQYLSDGAVAKGYNAVVSYSTQSLQNPTYKELLRQPERIISF